MRVFLVTSRPLPDADSFLRSTFGQGGQAINLHYGPDRGMRGTRRELTGTRWDGATLNGGGTTGAITFSAAQEEDVEALETLLPAGTDVMVASCYAESVSPTNDVRFVCDELLPCLADATGGVLVSDGKVIYRPTNPAARMVGPFPRFNALFEAREVLRSAPPSPAEDWSDLFADSASTLPSSSSTESSGARGQSTQPRPLPSGVAMTRRRSVTEEERIFLFLSKANARRVVAETATIPWPASEGLALAAVFERGQPAPLGLPAGLAKLPDVTFYSVDDEAAFIAQRFNARPVATWTNAGAIEVESWLFLTPRGFFPRDTRQTLKDVRLELEASGDLDATVKQLRLDETVLLGFDIVLDGVYDLYVGTDEAGEIVAWVVVFDAFEQDEWEPAIDFPLSATMQSFAAKRASYMLATREPLPSDFSALARSLGIARTKASNSCTWREAWIGTDLRVFTVDPADYHWYREELECIGFPRPPQLLRIAPPQGGSFEDVPDGDWEAMANTMEAAAREAKGILFRRDDDAVTAIDFGAPPK
jgi:hypothetical protein